MDIASVNSTIRFLLEDPDGNYATDAYIQPGLNLEWINLFNELGLSSSDFDSYTVELPSVPAGTADLSQFMASGQALDGLMTPREIEWKLPGQDPINYFDAEGPLSKLRDIPLPGIPALDCWSYKHFVIQLSRTSTTLDLRVTGDFIFPPVNPSDAQVTLRTNFLPALSYRIAAVIAEIRGNPDWAKNYQARADMAFDTVNMALVQIRQGKTERVGRMNESWSRGPNYAIGTH